MSPVVIRIPLTEASYTPFNFGAMTALPPLRYSQAMFVLIMEITFSLPWSRSLKDKRQAVRSLIGRLSQRFSLSVREVGALERRQTAIIGLAYVAVSETAAREMAEHLEDFIFEHSEMEVINEERAVTTLSELLL